MKKLLKNKKFIIGVLIATIFIAMAIGLHAQKKEPLIKLPYNQFISDVIDGKVERVELNSSANMKVTLKTGTVVVADNPRKEGFKEFLLVQGVKVDESSRSSVANNLVSLTLMIAVLSACLFVLRKGGSLGGGKAMGMSTQAIEPEKLNTGFNQIAGNVEAKEQVGDLIDFIKKPEKYNRLGARMPKGIILYGPPGTGKTLMAKAIAKEAGVPFYSASGSDFVQMYVGVGAARVRELFKEARKNEKAVIFIDEIDAIGKKRSMNAANSNDEKDQTLNALLTEMSGFSDQDGIVVIGATNRLDTIDEALLRPGRFDRHIEIGYPDVKAREAIINLYLKTRPVADEVSSEKLAKQTVYFTGAMLENLVNEAAICAANEGLNVIFNDHFETAFYTVVAGKEKKDRSMISELDRKITAYHEAGHALVTKLLAPDNSVTKVTIIPSTKGAGGFSMNIPKDRFYLNKTELQNRIKISIAGRAAEELIFGKDYITTGASNDIEKATDDLKNYVMRYGMDDELGLINLSVITGHEGYVSDDVIKKLQKYMNQFYVETMEVLESKKDILEEIATQLLDKETLDEDELNEIVGVSYSVSAI